MASTIRAQAQLGANGITTIKLLVQHPMLIERNDPKTGQTLPAHFIEELTVVHAGETVLSADFGQAVSMNPFLQFNLEGAKAGDTYAVSWRDNRGAIDRAEFTVK